MEFLALIPPPPEHRVSMELIGLDQRAQFSRELEGFEGF